MTALTAGLAMPLVLRLTATSGWSIDTRTRPPSAEAMREMRCAATPWSGAMSTDGQTRSPTNGPSNDSTLVDARTMRVMRRIPVGRRPGVITTAPVWMSVPSGRRA